MKKMIITIMLITGLFAQSNMTLVGGVNYATFGGSDNELEGVSPDNLLGFRFGLQQNLANGLISGATYTQRGALYSETEEGASIDVTFKVNYLTTYVLKPFPMQPGFDLLAGMEVGYFLGANMELKFCNDGDCESEDEDVDGDDWDDMDNNKIDYGLVVGGQYNINQQMSIIGTYYLGLSSWADEDDITNSGLTINIAYGL